MFRTEESDDMLDNDDMLNMKYQGSAATTQIVLRVKNELQAKRDGTPASALPTHPPSYDEIEAQQQRQPPLNPYYPSSPDASFNTDPVSSPTPLYPALTNRL